MNDFSCYLFLKFSLMYTIVKMLIHIINELYIINTQYHCFHKQTINPVINIINTNNKYNLPYTEHHKCLSTIVVILFNEYLHKVVQKDAIEIAKVIANILFIFKDYFIAKPFLYLILIYPS